MHDQEIFQLWFLVLLDFLVMVFLTATNFTCGFWNVPASKTDFSQSVVRKLHRNSARGGKLRNNSNHVAIYIYLPVEILNEKINLARKQVNWSVKI